MPETTPLRFVILCDSLDFPKWQADCVREVADSGLATLVGIVVNASYSRHSTHPSWKSRWTKRNYALWRLFNKFHLNRACKATIAENMEAFFRDVPKISDEPIKVGKYGEALTDEALSFVQKAYPHFVLRFGFGILKGGILSVAPYGVWSYHHGDPSKFRGQPPGFWEIYSGSPVTGSILQVLGDELDAGLVLHSGFFQTTLHRYAKTIDTIYLGSTSWVRRTCAAIQASGWPLKTAAKSSHLGSIRKQPTNREMMHFFFTTLIYFFRTQISYRLFRQDWTIGIVSAPIHIVAGLDGADKQVEALKTIHWMRPPDHCFIGDPFGYELDDKPTIRILFELLDQQKGIGTIASTCYKNADFGPVKALLESPTHLSYPYVMNEGGEIYFMPEHSAARDLSAFHLNELGETDQKITILPNSELIDSSIVRWNERYWLFALDDSRSRNSDLHIFYSSSWQGPWRAHPLNPVKTDIRNSRPAGTPFVHNGRLYRPAQDCATHYGSATVINEIISLDEANFEERPVARVQPMQGSDYQYGLHTLSSVGNFTLIDGARKNRVFW